MSRLRKLVGDYLTMRRSLGYRLKEDGRQLLNFASFVADAGSRYVTTKLAVRWATRPSGILPQTAAKRLGVVRAFAKFAAARDARNEVVPRDGATPRTVRPMPYVYSAAETRALIQAASGLRTSAFVKSTVRTLVGLLAVTGMRIGEALGLDRGDYDAKEGVLTIRGAKFGKSREVPLHPTVNAALRSYARYRDGAVPRPKEPSFFLSQNGTRLRRQNVSIRFERMLKRAGLADRKPRKPRIHDLRHTFAITTLCDWHRDGAEVEPRLPLLSTYLGHVNPASTYWYLTATPELAASAARRLEHALGRLP